MFDVCADTLELPLEEKMPFEQGDDGDSFGYMPSYRPCSRTSLTRDIGTKLAGRLQPTSSGRPITSSS